MVERVSEHIAELVVMKTVSRRYLTEVERHELRNHLVDIQELGVDISSLLKDNVVVNSSPSALLKGLDNVIREFYGIGVKELFSVKSRTSLVSYRRNICVGILYNYCKLSISDIYRIFGCGRSVMYDRLLRHYNLVACDKVYNDEYERVLKSFKKELNYGTDGEVTRKNQG